MAKIKPRLEYKCLRVGVEIDYEFKFSEFGTDDKGAFAVVEKLPGVAAMRKVIEVTTDDVFCIGIDSVEPKEPEEKQSATVDDVNEKAEKLKAATAKKMEEKKAAEEIKQKQAAEKAAEKKKNSKPIGPVKVTETLNVHLTDDERQAAAQNCSNMLGQLEVAELQLKNYVANERAIIKTLKEKISRSKSAHNTGMEYRSVTCMQHFDPAKLTTWFEYEGHQYGHRPMNEREERETRSNSLFGDAPELPNKINPEESKATKGSELAKIAAAHEQKKADDKKAESETKVAEFKKGRGRPKKEDVLPNGQSADADLRDVMNSETKRGGKHDHISN